MRASRGGAARHESGVEAAGLRVAEVELARKAGAGLGRRSPLALHTRTAHQLRRRRSIVRQLLVGWRWHRLASEGCREPKRSSGGVPVYVESHFTRVRIALLLLSRTIIIIP